MVRPSGGLKELEIVYKVRQGRQPLLQLRFCMHCVSLLVSIVFIIRKLICCGPREVC